MDFLTESFMCFLSRLTREPGDILTKDSFISSFHESAGKKSTLTIIKVHKLWKRSLDSFLCEMIIGDCWIDSPEPY